MILTKNRLKKNKFKDDDDMLYQLKFSHLEPIKEDNVLKIKTSDRGTQAPDIMNNHTQTDKKVMVDKETDTYDDLNIIEPPYYLTSTLSGFKSKEPSRAEKMAQVWTTTLEKKTPPSSNNGSDDEGFMSRNVDRGLRMAQLTGSAMLTAFNLADTVGSAVLSPVINSALDLVMNNPSDENEDEENEDENDEENVEEEEEEEQEAQVLRDRSRSRDSSGDGSEDPSRRSRDDLGNSLLRRGASRSRSSTPKGGYPSKKK